MTELFLSPHDDDQSLFASYVLFRYHPKVIVCLNGGRKKNYPLPATRAAESAAAMEISGCEFEHLGIQCDPPDWDAVEERLRQEDPDHVWAPFPEHGGHGHHNRVAEIAIWLWPGRVSFYSTYTCDESGWPTRSTDVGELVEPEPGWPELKRRALDCYATQIAQHGTRMHFERPLDETIVRTLRLNLGGGINPIPGFVNLDKSNGWMFEDGLAYYPDACVEAITVSHALMYVDVADWPFVFSEMARVLEPGGMIRITEDAIGGPGSRRPVIRPGAKVATTPELILDHLAGAGIDASLVKPDVSFFDDRSLIQQNYGSPPDVFHVEGRLSVRELACA